MSRFRPSSTAATAKQPISRRAAVGVSRFHEDQSGLISMASIVAALFFTVMIGMVANVGHAINHKMEVQNAADGVAYSSAVELARGMNAITAANHVMGELHSVCILHHAIGGDELDQGEKPSRNWEDELVSGYLDVAYNLADAIAETIKPTQQIYDDVKQDAEAGATMYLVNRRLQRVLAATYQCYVYAALIEKLRVVPIVGPFLEGLADLIYVTAFVFEQKVYQEWQQYQQLLRIAKVLVPVKKTIEQAVIPGVRAYAFAAMLETPRRLPQVINSVAKNGDASGALYPLPGVPGTPLDLGPVGLLPLARLPVRLEPDGVPVERCQLMRASYPWVDYWRMHLRQTLRMFCTLSRGEAYYQDFSQSFARSKTDLIRQQIGGALFILADLDNTFREKGTERWTSANESRGTDELFCVVGFGHRPVADTRVVSPVIYFQPNPSGIAAFAQAMIYNENQQLGQVDPAHQPVVGWDTLNWAAPVPEYPAVLGNAVMPQVQLNWQAKLVPVTRLRFGYSLPFQLVVGRQNRQLDAAMRKTNFLVYQTNTH